MIYKARVVECPMCAIDGKQGVHVWKPGNQTGESSPWPKLGKGLCAATHSPTDGVPYCPMRWTDGVHRTQSLLRLDLKERKRTTLDPLWSERKPMPLVEVKGKLSIACASPKSLPSRR